MSRSCRCLSVRVLPSCLKCLQGCDSSGGQHSPSCTDAGSSVTTQLQPRVWSWCCLHCLVLPASQPLSPHHVIPAAIQCNVRHSLNIIPTVSCRITRFYINQSLERSGIAWSIIENKSTKANNSLWYVSIGWYHLHNACKSELISR